MNAIYIDLIFRKCIDIHDVVVSPLRVLPGRTAGKSNSIGTDFIIYKMKLIRNYLFSILYIVLLYYVYNVHL